MKKIILKLIKAYQKSTFLRSSFFKFFYLSEANCRFQPTCSDYTYQAIEKYGIMYGCWMGFKRIIKCHPGSKGERDPLK